MVGALKFTGKHLHVADFGSGINIAFFRQGVDSEVPINLGNTRESQRATAPMRVLVAGQRHHIRQMTDGCPDVPRFVIALCPNCHRRAHFGRDARARNDEMQQYVQANEKDG